MKRLWDKGEGIDERMLRFTVGSDPQVDLEIFPYDCQASAAHARMLSEVGLLPTADLSSILATLGSIYGAALRREILIPPELEDCHTTLEMLLTERLGNLGKRIHTGRSRNDQVLVATRLYLRDACVRTLRGTGTLAKVFFQKAKEHSQLPMPGYTHLQPAMPSSVGMWFHSYAEALIDILQAGLQLLERIDKNPLGSASGFGTPLPIQPERTAHLLGFSAVHRSVIDAQNSRGRYERDLLYWFVSLGSIVEKFSTDVVLYLSKEFSLFTLPARFLTGSSLMPQKRNPDAFELLRARGAQLRGAFYEVDAVLAKLPGSFHRDFQASKEPTVRAIHYTDEMLDILPMLVQALEPNQASLTEKMYPELYATYDAFRRVQEGQTFRDAYVATAEALKNNTLDGESLFEFVLPIFEQSARGIEAGENELEASLEQIADWEQELEEVPRRVFSALTD
jgi:argininosuccinate lyase